MVKEFWLVRLVISTAAGRWATTTKFFSAISIFYTCAVLRSEPKPWQNGRLGISRIPASGRGHFERAKPAKTKAQYISSSFFFRPLGG
jgi:hypothetical protein